MTQLPYNLPDDDESQGVTQEANFPLAWIKDYDPKLHGIRPKTMSQQPPPGSFQNTPPGANRLPKVPQPGYVQPPARSYPPEAQGYYQPPQQNMQPPPGQWNPNGVYGGVPVARKKSFPWWGWVLLVVVVLLILAFIGYALKIYPAF